MGDLEIVGGKKALVFFVQNRGDGWIHRVLFIGDHFFLLVEGLRRGIFPGLRCGIGRGRCGSAQAHDAGDATAGDFDARAIGVESDGIGIG